MHAATEKYIHENETVLALRRIGPCSRPKWPSLSLALVQFKRQVRNTLDAGPQIIGSWFRHRDVFRRLAALKGAARGRVALVLGNGPSQGYLTPAALSVFKSRGDVFCVNRWSENAELAVVAPTYLTLSDPFDRFLSESDHEGHIKMADYLHRHKEIQIICPMQWVDDFNQQFGDRSIGFNDHEVRWLRNFNPMFPRGYVSMTLFKTLAMAIHMGYDSIYVLGMDNTYPRNLYCDSEQLLVSVRQHAGMDEYLECEDTDVAHLLFQLYLVFEDLNHFQELAGHRITNLDPYSLTDAFRKVATIAEGLALLDPHGR